MEQLSNGIFVATKKAGDVIVYNGFTVTVLSVRSGKVRLRFTSADGSEFEADQEEIQEDQHKQAEEQNGKEAS